MAMNTSTSSSLAIAREDSNPEIQRKKRCREEESDVSHPIDSECLLQKSTFVSLCLESNEPIGNVPMRAAPPLVVDNGNGSSDWVESQMRNISKKGLVFHNQSESMSSTSMSKVIPESVNNATYAESLERLEALQKLIEEDEVKLKPLQEQSDQLFNRLMLNEENWLQYVEWRKRNGLEVPKNPHNAMAERQPSILMSSGKSAFSPTGAILDSFHEGREPELSSTMLERLTPFSDLVLCMDELPPETDTLTKFAV